MLLLVDAGNTRVKWALIEPALQLVPGQWSAVGMVDHAELDNLSSAWSAFAPKRILAANVAGAPMRAALQRLFASLWGDRPQVDWFASVSACRGVKNGYRNPEQLGCDRFASVIGARALHPDHPVLVVTCGTATTIDALTANGVFMGGMILPGLGLMASALARNTAQLPQIAHDLNVAAPFADNTDAAIASGCLSAQAGAIERAYAAMTQSDGNVQCLLSGGAAELISPHLAVPHARIDNLVLIGLQVVACGSTAPC